MYRLINSNGENHKIKIGIYGVKLIGNKILMFIAHNGINKTRTFNLKKVKSSRIVGERGIGGTSSVRKENTRKQIIVEVCETCTTPDH